VAAAVISAVRHLPFECLCLPQAMAVQWMLRRRRVPARLLIGVDPAGSRASRHALHAWTRVGEVTVIGEQDRVHSPLLALDSPALQGVL